MSFVRRFLILLTAGSMASCASGGPAGVAPVALAPGVSLVLPTPAAFGATVEAAQMVTARHGDDVFVFEGRLSVKPDSVLLVGTDAMGRRAMTIRWTGERMEVERAGWLPDTLHPENVLADIILLYWPEEVVRRQLVGGELAATATGRTVQAGGKTMIAIARQGDGWTGVTRLSNLAWGYEIEVQSTTVSR